MKQMVKIETEVEATEIRMDLAVRYNEDDIPNDFPGRDGDILTLRVEIDTGKIHDFPSNIRRDVFMKVCDQGSYEIYSPEGESLAKIVNDYVPHGLVPGEFGDYVKFKIEGGVITNWPARPNLNDFFPED